MSETQQTAKPSVPSNLVCVILSAVTLAFLIGYMAAWYIYGYPVIKNAPTVITPPARPPNKSNFQSDALKVLKKGPGSDRFHMANENRYNSADEADHDENVVHRMLANSENY